MMISEVFNTCRTHRTIVGNQNLMGKHSRRARPRCAPVAEEPAACPVCFEPFRPPGDQCDLPDNALACANGHSLCVGCVSKLLEPTKQCSPECAHLKFTCPICRADACVSNFHSLVLLKGSWQGALRSFDRAAVCMRHFTERPTSVVDDIGAAIASE